MANVDGSLSCNKPRVGRFSAKSCHCQGGPGAGPGLSGPKQCVSVCQCVLNVVFWAVCFDCAQQPGPSVIVSWVGS